MTNALAIVDQYYACLAARDREGLLQVMDPDIQITYHSQPDRFPWSGEFSGIDGFDAFFAALKAHLQIVQVTVNETFCSDESVIKTCSGQWRVLANGNVVSGDMVNVFKVTGERITHYDVYADTDAFASAME